MGCVVSGDIAGKKRGAASNDGSPGLDARASTAPLSDGGSPSGGGGGARNGKGRAGDEGHQQNWFGAAFRAVRGHDSKRPRILGGAADFASRGSGAGNSVVTSGNKEEIGASYAMASGGQGSVASTRLRRQPSTYSEVHNLVLNHKLGPSAGLVGLRNLGNTCFMNSALQCLSNCVALTDYFLGFDWKKELNTSNPLGHGGAVAEAFGDLINTIWSTNASDVAPSAFKNKVGREMPQFRGDEQHDVQEFLALLLDAIHEDLNRCTSKPYVEDVYADGKRPEEAVAMEAWKGYLLRNKSIVVDTFQGQFRSRLRCKKCGHTSVKFDPFMYLSLPMGKVADSETITLERCLSMFCEQENLEGDNNWFCPKCKKPRAATKQLSLWKTPPVLIIHLKRFECGRNGGGRNKLNANVTFPLEHLDLTKFVESPQREAPDYDLFGVACHHGSLWGGHYTAFCRSRVTEQWHLFNDASCRAVQPNEVRSSAAYVLFYCKMAEFEVPNSGGSGTGGGSASGEFGGAASSAMGSPPPSATFQKMAAVTPFSGVLATSMPAAAAQSSESISRMPHSGGHIASSARASAQGAASSRGGSHVNSGSGGSGGKSVDRAPQLVRRQSLTKPHLWPHVLSEPEGKQQHSSSATAEVEVEAESGAEKMAKRGSEQAERSSAMVLADVAEDEEG